MLHALVVRGGLALPFVLEFVGWACVFGFVGARGGRLPMRSFSVLRPQEAFVVSL